MRTTAALSALLLSAGLVAGCGSDDGGGGSAGSGDYCDALKDAKADYSSLGSGTPDFDKFGEAIDAFHELADKAPSDVDAEWKTLDAALTNLETSLDNVGLSLKDLGAITQGQVPEGMTAEDLSALAPKLQEAFGDLATEDFEKATDAIEKHAKSECDIDLSEG